MSKIYFVLNENNWNQIFKVYLLCIKWKTRTKAYNWPKSTQSNWKYMDNIYGYPIRNTNKVHKKVQTKKDEYTTQVLKMVILNINVVFNVAWIRLWYHVMMTLLVTTLMIKV